MPHISIVIPHQLTQEEAVARIKEKAVSVRQNYAEQASGASDEWQGNTLHFAFAAMGFQVKGTMAVEPHEVQIGVDVPMMAMMFRAPIEKRVREELEQLLA
jgi:hypothetical protein